MEIIRPRGTKDILPLEIYKWHYIENIVRKIAEKHGYNEIRTPVFEHTELFVRGVGDTTDVVEKEMYTFEDRGGRSITLKPEGTAPVARAYIEHKLYAESQPVKLYYIIPVFRYEKPQAGRYRQHHQFGVEVFGSSSPSLDAEVISLAMDVYKHLNIQNLEVRINSIGCPKCRGDYNKILKDFLRPRVEKLCTTCRDRFDRNPMRIIDCKSDKCQKEIKGIPLMFDHICKECSQHFNDLQKYLEAFNIKYIVDPQIVRGLDYYTKTAFEIITDEAGKKGTLCGGGRYDKLVEDCGGPSIPGVGFGMGLERLLLSLDTQGIDIVRPQLLDTFIITLGSRAKLKGMEILKELRNIGIKADIDHMDRSIRAQFRFADRIMAEYVVIIGEDELDKNLVILRNMKTGKEEMITSTELSNVLREIFLYMD